jgi:pimeloyl-ACP methyl ester carboxylesterase
MTWLAALLPLALARPVEPSMTPDEVVPYTTPDGWTASLRRYAGDGPPVVLVHGMGANHYNWDFVPEVSLAAALQAARWDVWVVVLPGDGGTVPPAGLTLDDVDVDALSDVHLPAAIAAVQGETGADEVFWVGHSLGAMLLFASLDDQPIAAGVALCGAGQFQHPTGLVKTGRKLGKGRSGGEKLARDFAWTVPVNPILDLVGRRRHLDRKIVKGLARHAVDGSPKGVTRQIVRWVRQEGDLDRNDGTPLVDFASPVPILAFGATRDRLVSSEDVALTCERLPDCTYVELEGYGHVDPVLGTTAREAVFPTVVAWLEGQR